METKAYLLSNIQNAEKCCECSFDEFSNIGYVNTHNGECYEVEDFEVVTMYEIEDAAKLLLKSIKVASRNVSHFVDEVREGKKELEQIASAIEVKSVLKSKMKIYNELATAKTADDVLKALFPAKYY